jgi:hypothetical protein
MCRGKPDLCQLPSWRSLRPTKSLAKAEESANLAALAKTEAERNNYARMRHKWLGIADGWRVITRVDDARGSERELRHALRAAGS